MAEFDPYDYTRDLDKVVVSNPIGDPNAQDLSAKPVLGVAYPNDESQVVSVPLENMEMVKVVESNTEEAQKLADQATDHLNEEVVQDIEASDAGENEVINPVAKPLEVVEEPATDSEVAPEEPAPSNTDEVNPDNDLLDVSKSTIKEIMASVDGNAELAQQYLDIENAQESPRSSLVAKLEEVVNA